MYKYHQSRKVASPCQFRSQLEERCAALQMQRLAQAYSDQEDNAHVLHNNAFASVSFAPFEEEARGRVQCVALSPSGRRMAVGRGDHCLYIFDVDCQAVEVHGRFRCIMKLASQNRSVVDICFHNENVLASVCFDQRVVITDLTLPVEEQTLVTFSAARSRVNTQNGGGFAWSSLQIITPSGWSARGKWHGGSTLLLTTTQAGQGGSSVYMWDFERHLKLKTRGIAIRETKQPVARALIDVSMCRKYGWTNVLASRLLDDAARLVMVVLILTKVTMTIELVNMKTPRGEVVSETDAILSAQRAVLFQRRRVRLEDDEQIQRLSERCEAAFGADIVAIATTDVRHTESGASRFCLRVVVASVATRSFGDVLVTRDDVPGQDMECARWITKMTFCGCDSRLLLSFHFQGVAQRNGEPVHTHKQQQQQQQQHVSRLRTKLFDSDSDSEEEGEEYSISRTLQGISTSSSVISSPEHKNNTTQRKHCYHVVLRARDLKCVMQCPRENLMRGQLSVTTPVINAAAFHPIAGLIRGRSDALIEAQQTKK